MKPGRHRKPFRHLTENGLSLLMKNALPIRLSLLLALPCLLTACASYFDTAPQPAVARRVEARLLTEEGLRLEKMAKSPPESVEQALPKLSERLAKIRTRPFSTPATQNPASPMIRRVV